MAIKVAGTDMDKPLRVGIIGLSAERGWATAAHIPALHALSDDFELAGVANTSLASARLRIQAERRCHSLATVDR